MKFVIGIALLLSTIGSAHAQGESFSASDTVRYIEAQYEKAKQCRSHNYIDWKPPILRFQYFADCDRVYEEVHEVDMRYVTEVKVYESDGFKISISCIELCTTYE